MAGENGHIYEFSDFRLIPDEGLLLRNGEPVPLTLKAFATLSLLLERHGHLVHKELLIEHVWDNAFVEEAAVSRCIWTIRNALGDDSRHPKFIQTIPKRGYKFFADVSVIAPSPEPYKTNGAIAEPAKEPVSREQPDTVADRADLIPRRSKSIAVGIVVLALVILCVIGSGAYYFVGNRRSDVPILSTSLNIERLTTDGRAYHAVITPDGKKVYYVKVLGDYQSIRQRDLESGNENEFVGGAKANYGGLNLSRDGKTLYFTREFTRAQGLDFFRVPTTGGIPQKITSGVEGWAAVSNGGTDVSYVRGIGSGEGKEWSLYVADSLDGANERKLITRQEPLDIRANLFTPDDKSVIFANGQSHTAGNEIQLSKVEIATGIESPVTPERFFNIKHMAWAGEPDVVVITAIREPNHQSGVWKIDLDTGSAVLVDKIEGDFTKLSFNETASLMVTTQITEDFRLVVHDLGNSRAGKTFTIAEDAEFTPDGMIIFASKMAGDRDIWVVEPDGNNLQQLTSDPFEERVVRSSNDGASLFYSSNRSGDLQVWKMLADGTDAVRLTKRVGGYPISTDLSGRWVFFRSHLDQSIWRVAADGSTEEELFQDTCCRPNSVSPDGSAIAHSEKLESEFRISVMTVGGDAPARYYAPGLPGKVAGIKWSNDGMSIYYLQKSPADGKAVVFKQPVEGGSPIKLLEANVEGVFLGEGFAVSRDEKHIVLSTGDWKHDIVLIKSQK